MLLLILFALLAGAAAFLLFMFATVVDGDLTLVSRGPPRRERVDGKVVWITGASRGIGVVLAMQFANLGAKLILSARNKDELERVKQNILSKNPDSRVEVLPMDLSAGEESLKEIVHAAESLFCNAGVDYMIHNAAFERPKRGALEESEEGLKATINVNVIGTITLTRLLAPYMLDRGIGHFVVMSSAAGKVPAPGQAIYSASKHALNGYFASLRSELCTKGIKVTVVCPGPIETPQSSAAASSVQRHSSEKRVSVERCVELTIIAATHGLKEAWISYQPVLTVMYLVQYMPTIGYWLMDKDQRKIPPYHCYYCICPDWRKTAGCSCKERQHLQLESDFRRQEVSMTKLLVPTATRDLSGLGAPEVTCLGGKNSGNIGGGSGGGGSGGGGYHGGKVFPWPCCCCNTDCKWNRSMEWEPSSTSNNSAE